MCKYGVSCVELLVLYEVWVGHRLLPEEAVPEYKRANRELVIPPSPVSEGVQGDPILAGLDILAGCSVVMV